MISVAFSTKFAAKYPLAPAYFSAWFLRISWLFYEILDILPVDFFLASVNQSWFPLHVTKNPDQYKDRAKCLCDCHPKLLSQLYNTYWLYDLGHATCYQVPGIVTVNILGYNRIQLNNEHKVLRKVPSTQYPMQATCHLWLILMKETVIKETPILY